MPISLSPETEQLIEKFMADGGYATADEMVRVALQNLQPAGFIEDLDPAVQEAIRQAFEESDRGEGRPWEEVKAELSAKYLK